MKIKLKSLFLAAVTFIGICLLASCAFGGTEAHEHTFSKEWEIATYPTADADGLKSNVCDTCGEKVEAHITKHEHKFSEKWNIITPASTVDSGERSNVCDICGITITESVSYCDTHTITEQWNIITAPTHKNPGIKTNGCDVCGATITLSIDKLTITEFKITSLPNKTSYFTGDLFKDAGLLIEATLSDGSKINVTRGWEVLTTESLTSDIKIAKVKYEGEIFEIPITVSPATYSTVHNSYNYEDGTLLFVTGYYMGSCTTAEGEKVCILKDTGLDTFIFLKGANYEYKPSDKLEFFAEPASDANGKYLVYSTENENPEKTVVSSGNAASITLADKNKINTSASADKVFSDGVELYEDVTFTGMFYIVKNGSYYVIHFNPLATNESEAALSSGKTVRLSVENINDSIITDRISDTDLTSYPGAFVSGSISAFYIDNGSASENLQILKKDWIKIDPYTEGEEYIRELAYAFYYQLPYVDYEQYNNRRNMNPSPEEATEQLRIYLDCSSYVNSVYYNAFGVNILPYTTKEKSPNTKNYMEYARENPDAVDVLGYWETRDYKTDEERQALLSELLKGLRVGDVIVYRKGNAETLEENAGHALVYVGEGKILHCMNTESYTHNATNPDKAYDTVHKGSIDFESTANLFERSGATRYLFNSSYVNFTILRPMNRGLTPTEQTLKRMSIPSLSIEKSVDKNMFVSVFKGDLLTYTITLKNNGFENLTDVNILEFVPLGTEFVSASEGVTFADGSIKWTGTVRAGLMEQITFTVKVITDEAGTYIESGSGTVNGLYLNKITNTVSTISKETFDELANIGDSVKNEKFDDPILMINKIYSELLGKNVLDYESVSKALDDIIDLTGKKVNENCDIADILMANLSGGYSIRGTNAHNNGRIRAIRIEYLSAGDVIIAEHSTDKDGLNKRQVAYLYLGDNNFLKVSSNDGVCTIATYKVTDPSILNDLLTTLYSYERYAIIRPSLADFAE